ncbi:Phox-like protein [Trichoderma citrinoviride]|uniref:Endosomal/vacuolar adapter protein YPT35 n=1 Tax=Trichoderma citrinoviride TaxID=58853 RepID=A0A2T4BHI4_9HYPO|nr:Phox-like protein [Trichoderma citrinoviride]PTB68772.1 Phox-like protein [Trichoderma citrinoviride]
MAPAVDEDHAPSELTTSETGPQPAAAAESGATAAAAPSRALSRLDTQLNSSRDDDSLSREQAASQANNAVDGGEEALRTATTSPSSIASPPPYWPHAFAHQRTASNLSAESILPITLRDNDTSDDDRNSACWAKSVEITDYIVVNGSNTNIGAFVVWNVRVETLSGSYMNIRKRYSEFDDFRQKLTSSFPNFKAAVPELPPKSAIFKFRPKFLEKRRAGLQYFLKYDIPLRFCFSPQ